MWIPDPAAHFGVHVATSITPADEFTGNLITYIVVYGGPFGIIALALAFALYKGTFVLAKTANADRDSWRKAFEDERQSHQLTREALAVANSRAQDALESAQVAKQLLEAVQKQKGP